MGDKRLKIRSLISHNKMLHTLFDVCAKEYWIKLDFVLLILLSRDFML